MLSVPKALPSQEVLLRCGLWDQSSLFLVFDVCLSEVIFSISHPTQHVNSGHPPRSQNKVPKISGIPELLWKFDRKPKCAGISWPIPLMNFGVTNPTPTKLSAPQQAGPQGMEGGSESEKRGNENGSETQSKQVK